MRQVFTSARLENVEKVAKMLEDAGIETRVTQSRSYKGGIRGNFSYRAEPGERLPAVWIVKSEDQLPARELLREAGLMDSSRNAADSYLSMGLRGTTVDPHADAGRRRAFRIKVGLLLAIVAVSALAFMAYRPSMTPATPATTQVKTPATASALATVPTDLPGPGTVATPESLAIALLNGELPTQAGEIACLAVDGEDAPASLLAALPASPGIVLPLSRCPANAAAGAPEPQVLAVGKYVANEAGTGTIFLQRRRVGGRAVPQWYDVRRDGDGWRIVQPL